MRLMRPTSSTIPVNMMVVPLKGWVLWLRPQWLIRVAQIGFYGEVFIKTFNLYRGGREAGARGQAVLSLQPRHGAHRAKDSRGVEEHQLVDEPGAQARPVDGRSAFHQQAGDLLGSELGKDPIEIATPLVRKRL